MTGVGVQSQSFIVRKSVMASPLVSDVDYHLKLITS